MAKQVRFVQFKSNTEHGRGVLTRHLYMCMVFSLKFSSAGVMCSYNAINSVPTCADERLTEILRGTWSFDGYITSDSGAGGSVDALRPLHIHMLSTGICYLLFAARCCAPSDPNE